MFAVEKEIDSRILDKKPVIIQWVDIASWSGWNQELIDNNEDEPIRFYTTGFIVRQDEKRLTISDTYPDIGSVTVFPTGCIEEIHEL